MVIEHDDATLGTEWCAPGEGATVRTLITRIPWRRQYERANPASIAARRRLREQVYPLSLGGEAAWRRTNLRLTGRPLTATDLERVARCEVAR